MTFRYVLISLSVILTIAFILTSCGSPNSPVIGDSYDNVKRWLIHLEEGRKNTGYIIYQKDRIIYKHRTTSENKDMEDTVTEYFFKENILYKTLWVIRDEDLSALDSNLNGPLSNGLYQSIFVEGKLMYYSRITETTSEYLYNDWSGHFNARSLHRLTVLE